MGVIRSPLTSPGMDLQVNTAHREVGTSYHATLQERRAARRGLGLEAHRGATAARDWSNATTTSGEGTETWCFFKPGQFMTTSAEVTPNGGLVRESPPKWPEIRLRTYNKLPRNLPGNPYEILEITSIFSVP